MNEFNMNSIETLAEMLRDSTDKSWAQVQATKKDAEDQVIREFEVFLKEYPSTFKLLAEIPNTDKGSVGFFILATAILSDASDNFLFYELAGGKERLIEYLNSIANRISALESQNKLLMETIKELSKEK